MAIRNNQREEFSDAEQKARAALLADWPSENPKLAIALRMGARAIAEESLLAKNEAREEEILYFLRQSREEGASDEIIAKILALGCLALLWRHWMHSDVLRAAKHGQPAGAEAVSWINARAQYFDWAQALQLRPLALEREIVSHTQLGNMGAMRLFVRNLAEGPNEASCWPQAIAPLRRLAQVKEAFYDTQAALTDNILAQNFVTAGIRWSLIGGEEAKDAFLGLAREWSATLWLRESKTGSIFSQPLQIALRSNTALGAEGRFRQEWTDWVSQIPGMVDPGGIRGLPGLVTSAHNYHPVRLIQAVRIAVAAGADLDAIDADGWTLLGHANNKAREMAKNAPSARTIPAVKLADWEALATELLHMGANPWGIRQQKSPADECATQNIKQVAKLATERWELMQTVRKQEKSAKGREERDDAARAQSRAEAAVLGLPDPHRALPALPIDSRAQNPLMPPESDENAEEDILGEEKEAREITPGHAAGPRRL